MGGLGIQSLNIINVALLAKSGWNIICDAEGIWASLCKAKYLRHTSFLDSSIPIIVTWAWKGISKLIPHFRLGASRKIQDE